MKFSGFMVAILAPAVGLSGCASIMGVPQGLSAVGAPVVTNFPVTAGLPNEALTTNIAVANNLLRTYQAARNDNLKFAFWSNAALIPLATGAATAAVAKSSTQSLSYIAIAAASIVGFNSFVNARPNSRSYQSGMNATTCLIVNLSPYTPADARPPGAGSLPGLSDKAVPLDAETTAWLGTPTLTSGMSPDRAPRFAAALTDLKQAVVAAKQQTAAQAIAQGLYNQVAIFAANSLLQIDGVVTGKVSQSDVTSSALPTSPTPVPAAKPGAGPAGGPKADLVPGTPTDGKSPAPPPPPVNDIADQKIRALQTMTAELNSKTSDLADALAKFTLAAQESAVTTCIKSM